MKSTGISRQLADALVEAVEGHKEAAEALDEAWKALTYLAESCFLEHRGLEIGCRVQFSSNALSGAGVLARVKLIDPVVDVYYSDPRFLTFVCDVSCCDDVHGTYDVTVRGSDIIGRIDS